MLKYTIIVVAEDDHHSQSRDGGFKTKPHFYKTSVRMFVDYSYAKAEFDGFCRRTLSF